MKKSEVSNIVSNFIREFWLTLLIINTDVSNKSEQQNTCWGIGKMSSKHAIFSKACDNTVIFL